MIPDEGAELPEGSDVGVVRTIRGMASAAPRQGGIVSFIEGDEDGLNVHVIGNRPWSGSPLFVILEYFGMPYTADLYHRVLRSAIDEERGKLFIRPEENHREGEPIKAALVQTVMDWTLEDANEFLTSHKH